MGARWAEEEGEGRPSTIYQLHQVIPIDILFKATTQDDKICPCSKTHKDLNIHCMYNNTEMFRAA